jgi:hypothetical protein
MRRWLIAGIVAVALAGVASVALVTWLTGVAAPPSARAGEARAPAGRAEPHRAGPVEPREPALAQAPALELRGASARTPARPPLSPVRPAEAKGAEGRRLDLSFKMDRRLTRSLHIGDRWISPPTYTRSGGPTTVTVQARARLVGIGDETAQPPVAWLASEPDMIQVSPEEGHEVEITIWRAGESSLAVSSNGMTRTLDVKAVEAGGGLRVAISQ